MRGLTESERYDAATLEIKAAIEAALRTIAPKVQRRYRLLPRSRDLAITRAIGLVTIDCAKRADVPLTKLAVG